MMLRMFTVYDAKAESYIQPFFSPNAAMAVRLFQNACVDEDHDFFRHAEDYSLWIVADFDQETGDVLPVEMSCIARAHELCEKNL